MKSSSQKPNSANKKERVQFHTDSTHLTNQNLLSDLMQARPFHLISLIPDMNLQDQERDRQFAIKRVKASGLIKSLPERFQQHALSLNVEVPDETDLKVMLMQRPKGKESKQSTISLRRLTLRNCDIKQWCVSEVISKSQIVELIGCSMMENTVEMIELRQILEEQRLYKGDQEKLKMLKIEDPFVESNVDELTLKDMKIIDFGFMLSFRNLKSFIASGKNDLQLEDFKSFFHPEAQPQKISLLGNYCTISAEIGAINRRSANNHNQMAIVGHQTRQAIMMS
ncbi:hypothetical protein FGO68_gene12846 [Halteria grandinella]|uniref:Uncharacterized protein n=1 Tax=Halteria grandinella TaxID=5974 RepID=A0A8J8NUM3_HALGN|nr:hypothetical protein FGO68_gene12846 [Halteria grandinella]